MIESMVGALKLNEWRDYAKLQNEAIVEYYNGNGTKMQELARVKAKAKKLFPK